MKQLLAAVIALGLSLGSFAQKADDIVEYINKFKDLAIAEMVRTGVPASITLAQGIHETMAGKSVLVLKSNNHFGIKCKSTWTGKKVYHDDDALGECFRSYEDPGQSYVDHSNFLKYGPRYAFLFQIDPHDYKAWAYGLKKAGYATNSRYSQILIRLIEDYNLQQYSLIALGELKPTDAILVSSKPQESPMKVTEAVIRTTEPIAKAPQPSYPSGEFKINHTKVIFAKAGTSLLSIAEEYNIGYARLLEFNELKDVDVLSNDQLVYLQRKRKVGNSTIHVVAEGETLYDIAQREGIRLEALAELNLIQMNSKPVAGEKLQLQQQALGKPILEEEVKSVVAVVSSPGYSDMAKGPSHHIVQTKETLYSIARKYQVAVEQLKEWNRLSGTDLKVGQELVIIKN